MIIRARSSPHRRSSRSPIVAAAPLLVLALVGSGCGLYGEEGFTGTNPVSSGRFVEKVDDLCTEVNDDLDEDTAAELVTKAKPSDDTEDAIIDLRNGIDELVERLPDNYGPQLLEDVRDAYVETLEQVDEDLEAALEAIDDEQADIFRAKLQSALAALGDADQQLRTAGFTVCGTPRAEQD